MDHFNTKIITKNHVDTNTTSWKVKINFANIAKTNLNKDNQLMNYQYTHLSNWISTILNWLKEDNVFSMKKAFINLLWNFLEDKFIYNMYASLQNNDTNSSNAKDLENNCMLVRNHVESMQKLQIDEFNKIHNDIITKNYIDGQTSEELYRKYFDYGMLSWYQTIKWVWESYTIPKIRSEEYHSWYNEDALYFDKDIAIVVDWVSDSDIGSRSHPLVKFLASHKSSINSKQSLQSLIMRYLLDNPPRTFQGMWLLWPLVVVVNSSDGSRTWYMFGDSSLFIDGKEFTYPQTNIAMGLYESNPLPNPKMEILNDWALFYKWHYQWKGFSAKVPNIHEISIPPESKVMLATDEVAKNIRMNATALNNPHTIPFILKWKSIKVWPMDDLSYIVLE
jgi:hypothetical protein